MAIGNSEINVAFASTGYGPLWAPAVSSWLRLIGFTARHFAIEHIGKIGGAGVTDRMYTHAAENRLVREMRDAEPKFTHLFMTESDMILPHDAIVKLVALDKPIASGVYFLRANEQEASGQPCLYKRPWLTEEEKKEREHAEFLHTPIRLFPTDAPFQIDSSGLGCLLIKAEVFDIVPEPWFDLKADGYGSDFFFSKHCKDAGVEQWADPTVLCEQVDYYFTSIRDWKWRLENDPGFVKTGYVIGTPGADPFFKK